MESIRVSRLRPMGGVRSLADVTSRAGNREDHEGERDAHDAHDRHGILERVSALLLHLGQPRLLLVRSEDLGLLLFSHGDDPEAAGGARGHLHGAGSEAHGNTAARGDTPAIDRGEEERGVSVGSVKVVRERGMALSFLS